MRYLYFHCVPFVIANLWERVHLGCMACSIAMITGNPCEISDSHVGRIASRHCCISQYPSVLSGIMRTSMVAFELKSAQWDAQLPLFQEGRPFSAFGAESQLSSRHDA